MRRLKLMTSVAASLSIAAIIVGCSSDTKSLDPLSTPTSDTQTPTSAVSLAGGGWSPAVETAAAANDKVTVCHSGNGKHFTQITVSAQGARAHLGDSQSGKGGHADDYRVSTHTPCPPPATPGNIQVCKVAGPGVAVGSNFTFTLLSSGGSKSVTVAAGAAPAGTCASGGDYSIGSTVEVRETAQQGISTTNIAVSPAGAQQGMPDLVGQKVTVIAGVGTTTATFTNRGPTGLLAICKVAGTGVTSGTNFTFSVAGQTATVPAGAAPAGTCTTTPLTVGTGNVVVTEGATTGVSVTGVTATGANNANALVTSDLPNRSATVTITSGQTTTVTFTNAATPTMGTLVICKIGGTGVAAGSQFSFSAGGQTQTVAAGAAPNGTCGTAISLAPGAVTVTETAVTGTSVQTIGGAPAAPTNINLVGRSATVQINAGQETRITFTNVAP